MENASSSTSSPVSSLPGAPDKFTPSIDPQENYNAWIKGGCKLKKLGVEKSIEMLKWAKGEGAQLDANAKGEAYTLEDVVSWANQDLKEIESSDNKWNEVQVLVTSMSTDTQSKKIDEGGGANSASLSLKSVQIEDSKKKETPLPPSQPLQPTPSPSSAVGLPNKEKGIDSPENSSGFSSSGSALQEGPFQDKEYDQEVLEDETKKGGGTAEEASSWKPTWATMFLGAIIALGALAYWQKDTVVNWWQGRKINQL